MGHHHDISTTSVAISSLAQKCSEIQNTLFCHEFMANDYTQVFMIAMILVGIHIGLYFLHHSNYAQLPIALHKS